MAKTKMDDTVSGDVRELAAKGEEALEEAGRKLAAAVLEFLPEASGDVRRVIDGAFDYLESALNTQRRFIDSVLDGVASKSAETATRPPRKAAAKKQARGARKTKPAA